MYTKSIYLSKLDKEVEIEWSGTPYQSSKILGRLPEHCEPPIEATGVVHKVFFQGRLSMELKDEAQKVLNENVREWLEYEFGKELS